MSYSGLLRHSIVIEHPAVGTEDEWGHIDPAPFADGEMVKGLVQDRRGAEVERSGDLGGTVIADVLVFLQAGAIVTEQDRLRRVDTGAEYEVVYVKDAAGQGHHSEVLCRLVKSEAVGS
jgi:Phage head-tail joining protein